MRKTLLALLAFASLVAPMSAQQPVSQSGRWLTEPTNVVRTSAVATFDSLADTATIDTTGAEYLVAEFDTIGSFAGRVDFTRLATGITDQHFFGAYNLRNIYTNQTDVAGPDRWTFTGADYPNPILALALPPGTTSATFTVAIYTSGSMTITLRAVHAIPAISQLPTVAAGQQMPNYLTALAGREADGSAKALRGNDGILRVEVSNSSASLSPIATRLTDGTNYYKATTPSDTQPVSATALPLPAGAATAAKQDEATLLLADITGKLPNPVASEATLAAIAAAVGAPGTNPITATFAVGGKNLDGGNLEAIPLQDTTPAGSDLGVVTRNIPSGTQAVSVAAIPSHAVTNAGTFAVQVTSAPTTAVTNAGLSNLDVALSTRTKPADQQHTIIDSSATLTVTGPLTDTQLRATPVPISGSIANTGFIANAGTNLNTSALALDATLTGGTQQTKITDGTNVATVKAASTAAAAADKAVVVAISPNNVAAVSLASVPTHSVDSITTAIVPGTAATNLGKAEDAGHTSGDTGVMTLGVRKDTATQQTSADADYGAFSMDAYGAQFTRVDHPNRIRCTVTTSTATVITAVGGSCVAPGAGLSIYITDIMFSASAAGIAADAFPTLKYGTGGTCGTGTTVFWGALTAAATRTSDNFNTPLKIPANNEVCWITSTAGSKFIVISGYIAP